MNHDTCFLNNFQHQKQWIRCMCQVSKTFLIPCHVLFRRWKHPRTHRKPLSRLDKFLQPRIGRLCKERLVDRLMCRKKKYWKFPAQKTMDSQFQSRTRFELFWKSAISMWSCESCPKVSTKEQLVNKAHGDRLSNNWAATILPAASTKSTQYLQTSYHQTASPSKSASSSISGLPLWKYNIHILFLLTNQGQQPSDVNPLPPPERSSSVSWALTR